MGAAFVGVAMGVYTAVAGAFVYVLLFGQSARHRGTAVGRLHAFLAGGGVMRSVVAPCVRAVCGARAAGAGARCVRWACEEANPLLQLFYLALVLPGYFVWLAQGRALLAGVGPAAGLSVSAHGAAVHAAVAAALCSFVVACVADPGVLTPRTAAAAVRLPLLVLRRSNGGDAQQQQQQQQRLYPRDGVLYKGARGRPCATCGIAERPARSKHCRVCGRCVARLDHHCPWTNNCVGARNMRWFLLFLATSTVMCAYASWLCARLVVAFLRAAGLLGRGLSWSVLFAVALRSTGLVAPLALFSGAMSLVLAGFVAFQMSHVLRGVTTAETFRWEDVRCEIADAAAAASSKDGETKAPASTPASIGKLENVYDRGAWTNFLEMLFPPNFEAEARKQEEDTKRTKKHKR